MTDSNDQNRGIRDASVQQRKQQQQQQEEEEEEDWKVQFQANKSLGDQAFRGGSYETAAHHYSAALSLDPDSAVVLSNRSAAYLKAGRKSKALHDAQSCVEKGYGIKGVSRLAAALQSLGRYSQALERWNEILKRDPSHAAAKQGKEDCEAVIETQRQQEEEEEEAQKKEEGKGEDDLLDDFFNDVEEATDQVANEKELAAQEKATNAIKHHKKDLGTAEEQVARLLPNNYQWYNLNPFRVLDLPHTASADDIARRYKALSLLLHPDKNQNLEKAQEAYDEVLKAKAALQDEDKARHVRQLIEQGMVQGQKECEKRHGRGASEEQLGECQKKAVQRLFAEIEHTRRQVEQRERNQQQREQRQEEEAEEKEKKERQFDRNWKQEERVEKRIGNWRDFAKSKKKKKEES